MIGIKATSKNAFCVTNNGSMKSENTPRNKFRTPFTDPRCFSKQVPYPICRVKTPFGTGYNQRKSSVSAVSNNHYNAHLKTKHAYGTVKPGAA